MDRADVDLRNPTPGARPTPGASVFADPDQVLWRQFAEASTPDVFYRAWLALQCRMITGVTGGVVVLGPPDTGPYTPAAFWPEGGRNLRHLAEVAEKTLVERRGLVMPRAGRADDPSARPRYDVAYPIQVSGRLLGVVALDIAPRQEVDLQWALRQLQWGAAWLETLTLRGELTRTTVVRDRLQQVLDLVGAAFGHDRFYAAASAFVTAVATRLNCDRVSFGVVVRGRTRVQAISHSARFGEQTNVVRAVAEAMDEAIDQHATIVHPPPAGSRPVVTRAASELARQHGAGAICTVPLAEGGRVFGALTFERPADQPFDAVALDVCEALGGLAGPILERSRRDDRWIGAKLLDAGRHGVERLTGPGHVGFKLGAVAAVVVALVLAFARGEFRVAANASLEPVARQAAVAPFNGYIAQAPARAGDVVRREQLLAALDDREMRLERMKWSSQFEQLARQHQQALALRNAAQVMILSAQMDQARAEVALLDSQLARTRIAAPFDAIVVTGDLSQSLAAPVERGQVLFELAPLNAYRVVLQVDERDVTFVQVGQRGTLVLTGAPADGLPLLVEKITPVSAQKDGRNYFRVEAKLERGLERLRPGMEGVGKVAIDRRPLVWIWTRQVIDWMRLQLWTWLP